MPLYGGPRRSVMRAGTSLAEKKSDLSWLTWINPRPFLYSPIQPGLNSSTTRRSKSHSGHSVALSRYVESGWYHPNLLVSSLNIACGHRRSTDLCEPSEDKGGNISTAVNVERTT